MAEIYSLRFWTSFTRARKSAHGLRVAPSRLHVTSSLSSINQKEGHMKKLLLILALGVTLSGCNKPDIPTLLQWSQYGIDADCQFGSGGLAADICTFGTDAITAAKAAYAHDPVNGTAAVKKILIDAELKQPKLADYLDWFVNRL